MFFIKSLIALLATTLNAAPVEKGEEGEVAIVLEDPSEIYETDFSEEAEEELVFLEEEAEDAL